MNDLRSLEGIGQLLSQKFNQNSKHKLRSRHLPLISSSTPTASNNTTTPICEYFPAEIASLLSTNIQMGYYSNIASQAPVLLKSHSDFVREDIFNKFNLIDLSDSEIKTNNNNESISVHDDECIILNLPIDTSHHTTHTTHTNNNNNNNNDNNTDSEFSFSLALPPSLAPLVLEEDDYNNNQLIFINDNNNNNNNNNEDSLLVMDIIASYDDEDIEEESDDDIELFDLRNDYMQYQNKNTNKNTFNNIGNGASGIVRKAFHYKSCKMVAIKQCRSKQKHEICAAIKEAKLYAEFSENAHIINMFEYGKDVDDGDICIALEYMDLGSIDTLNMHEREDKELIVRYIIYSVLLAINELHNNLYVHNDIKMANILSNKYGEIKVSDFGTVLKLDDKHSYLTTNNGTQIYQSPEKLTKQVCKYNTKTDIWSIGITAYELLFGERNDDNQLSYITNTPLLTPKKCNLSANCCDFLNKCLIYDDKQRPSAQQLLAHKWFNNKPVISKNIWPWLVSVDENEKKHKKRRSFGINNIREHEYYNEDLLFMISALIINYSKQNVNLEYDSYDLYRRISQVGNDKDWNLYSDCERIKNMAHYALCSSQMVIQRIRVTVAYIKSQLNKVDVSRIDS